MKEDIKSKNIELIRKNCWEHKKCGRYPDGLKAEDWVFVP